MTAGRTPKRGPVRRNPMAREVHAPKYRPRVVPTKKRYRRKAKRPKEPDEKEPDVEEPP